MTDNIHGLSLFSRRKIDAALLPHVPLPELFSSRPSTAIRAERTEPVKAHSRRESGSLSSLSEFGQSIIRRRSESLRSRRAKSPTFWDNITSSTSTETLKRSTGAMRPQLAPSATSYQQPPSTGSLTVRPPQSAADHTSLRPQQYGHTLRREESNLRPPTAGGTINNANRAVSAGHPPTSSSNQQEPRTLTRKALDAAAKRISLLTYLRKMYDKSMALDALLNLTDKESRYASELHWFNTYRFTPHQIRALPSMHPTRLARRTQSLLLLGISLPFVLDPNRDSIVEYLRAFSALLSEYDSYITLHPPDGGSSSALSRARIPQMFKRGPGKARRGSSADALLTSPQSANDDPRSAGGMNSGPLPTATWTSFPAVTQEHDLLPGEDYHYLLTPSLPFDADYFETFATLCEVLSDCYRHLTALLEKQEAQYNAGDNGSGLLGVTESFAKVDAKVKKIVLAGLVKEFEDASRQSIRSELAGVGKLVLGGLI